MVLDLALDDLGLAVVADPVRADVEAREPLHAGLLQLGQRLADPLAGDGDVEVAGPREPEGAGQVDRLDDLPRDERRADGGVRRGRARRTVGRCVVGRAGGSESG